MKKIFFACLFIIFLCAGILIMWDRSGRLTVKSTTSSMTTHTSEWVTATVLNPAKQISDFSLTATQGDAFTPQSFLGRWTLLFFGYTECPQICPQTLAVVTGVWNLLPAKMHNDKTIQFVFVSLDPEYDRVENLRNFLGRFHPSFIGVTGQSDVVKKLAQECSIYSWRDPNQNAGEQKMIDHSATLLLINPKGQIQALFSPPHQKEAIAKDIHKIIHSSVFAG